MSILIDIFTVLLVCVSVFLILVVLGQKSKDGGMGSALGGSATESAFGHETGNVLTKMTINAAVLFFVLSFSLYLARIYESKHRNTNGGGLPEIAAPAGSTLPKVPGSTSPATTGAAPADIKVTLPPPTSSATATPATTSSAAAAPTPPVESAPTKPADAPKPTSP